MTAVSGILAQLAALDPVARYYLFALVVAVPVVQVFRRAGFRPYWAALLGVPQVGLILCLLLLALRKWPQSQGA